MSKWFARTILLTLLVLVQNAQVTFHCQILPLLASCSIVFFQDLDLYEMLAETEKRGIAFDQLLAIPEQDEWVYSDGKSTTCVAFILSMYKEAGILGPISSSIQVTEFTVSHISESLSLSIYSVMYCFWSCIPPLNVFSSWSLYMTWALSLNCRFATHICLRSLMIIKHGYQIGATMRMDGSHSARFLVSIGWNCLSITR